MVGALFAVALEDGAAGGCRNVACLRRRRRLSRMLHFAEALLLELLEERVERSVEDRLEVAARVSMGHEVAGAVDLRSELRACGEHDLVAFGGERLDPPWRDV